MVSYIFLILTMGRIRIFLKRIRIRTFWIILSGLGLFLEYNQDSADGQLKCLTIFLLKSRVADPH